MKIGLDLIGGDNPLYLVEAINDYIKDNDDEIFLYTTKSDEYLKYLEGLDNSENINVVYCQSQISKEDDPSMVIRTKKDSTLVMGVKDLKDNVIDAFISAGNTGALVASGIFIAKRIKGISKPALPGFVPKPDGDNPLMLLDLGANIMATKENLVEYAHIASKYVKAYYGINKPIVKLLNIGEEEKKGTDLYKEVYQELSNDSEINFQGNLEARDVLRADCDIVVMDGWTGNVLLKSIEGAIEVMGSNTKKVFLKSLKNKLAALTLKKDLKDMAKDLDYRELGGTPVLGIDGLLIKAHGSSNKRAFYQAIMQAKSLYNSNFIEKLKND